MKAMITALNSTTPWWVKLLLPVIVSGLLTWGSTHISRDRDIEHRVTALEQSNVDDGKRLDRIENKIDQLVGWALGK